MTTILRTDTYL